MINLQFLCFQVAQLSEHQDKPLQLQKQRPTVRPVKSAKSHKDPQQISASRFIKTIFNKNNWPLNQIARNNVRIDHSQEGKILNPNKQQPMNPLSINRTISHQYNSITNNNSSVYQYGFPITDSSPTFRQKSGSYSTHSNGQILIRPFMLQSQSNNKGKSINVDTCSSMPYDIFRDDFRRRLNYEMQKTPVRFVHRNEFQTQQNIIPLMGKQQNQMTPIAFLPTHSFFQPVLNNYRLVESRRNLLPTSFLIQQVPSQAAEFNLRQKLQNDDEQQQPLKSKFISERQKKKCLISEQQIKNGFNNGFFHAIKKVKKLQHWPQQQPRIGNQQQRRHLHSISIVSNLISESYSPLKKDLQEQSTKKKKRPIFSSSAKIVSSPGVKNMQSIHEYHTRATIFKDSAEKQYETPQSMKLNQHLQEVRQYEMKTENKSLHGQSWRDFPGDTNMNQSESIVPVHILNAWKRVNQED